MKQRAVEGARMLRMCGMEFPASGRCSPAGGAGQAESQHGRPGGARADWALDWLPKAKYRPGRRTSRVLMSYKVVQESLCVDSGPTGTG